MTPGDFKAVRALYGETQEQFGRRLGFEGARGTVERAVRRYENGETPTAGTMAALIACLRELAHKPDTRRRRKAICTEGKA